MKMTTARTTGLLYLGMALTGMLAFLFARQKLFVDGDAVSTSANLVAREGLARFGIAAELALVGFQALTALWFYRLFRTRSNFVAGLIAVFGMVNAIAILVATAMWLTALNVAVGSGQVETVYTLVDMHDNIWAVASLFFGLWLLPVAYMARVSKMPRVLAGFLYAGGIGYILSAFTNILLPEQTALTEALPLAATIGEFWMVGYLIVKPVSK